VQHFDNTIRRLLFSRPLQFTCLSRRWCAFKSAQLSVTEFTIIEHTDPNTGLSGRHSNGDGFCHFFPDTC
jgi:hypothetical protein